jgi:hypothetical protein
VWDFDSQSIPENLLADLVRFEQQLSQPDGILTALEDFLSPAERRALRRRVRHLIDAGCFPAPSSNRRPYPWPPV